MKKYRDEPSTSRTPDMSSSFTSTSTSSASALANLGGGLKFGYEPHQSSTATATAQQLQHAATAAGLVINTNAVTMHSLKESPPSSPGSEASSRKRRKGNNNTSNSLTPLPSPVTLQVVEAKKEREEKETKSSLLQNGAIAPTTHHMLGNQINPSGNMAKTMTETLNMEIEAHSIYTTDQPAHLVGPQYPGRKESVRMMMMMKGDFRAGI
jgi:hypothetical protein